MTFEEFSEIADNARIEALSELENAVDYYLPLDFPKSDELIGFAKTGESSGGNCWGDTASYQSFSSNEGNMTYALKPIIKVVAPEISFLAYDDLSKLIKSDSITLHEYYGNYHEFDYSTLDNRTIYDFLKERGYV